MGIAIWMCRACKVVGAVPRNQRPWHDAAAVEHEKASPTCEERNFAWGEIASAITDPEIVIGGIADEEEDPQCFSEVDPDRFLAACPFCGLSKLYVFDDLDADLSEADARIICESCHAKGPEFDGEHSLYMAIIGWNSRGLKPEQLAPENRVKYTWEPSSQRRLDESTTPCPFCSAQNIVYSDEDKAIFCLNCGTEGPNKSDDDATQDELVGYWNARGTGKALEPRTYREEEDPLDEEHGIEATI